MKSVKKFIILIISLIIVGVIASKVIILLESDRIGANERNIYNNEEKIVSKGDSYSYLRRKLESEENNMNFKFVEFTGIDTAYTIESTKEGIIKLQYDSEILDGEFKILLITPKNEIVNILSGNSKGDINIKIESGQSKIRIVGYKSTGSFKMNVISSDGVGIKLSEL